MFVVKSTRRSMTKRIVLPCRWTWFNAFLGALEHQLEGRCCYTSPLSIVNLNLSSSIVVNFSFKKIVTVKNHHQNPLLLPVLPSLLFIIGNDKPMLIVDQSSETLYLYGTVQWGRKLIQSILFTGLILTWLWLICWSFLDILHIIILVFDFDSCMH